MMKKTNRSAVAFGALVLACVCLVGGYTALATGGDQSDPLVTLSYLTKVVTPQLTEKVNQQVAANEQALTQKLDQAITNYSNEMKQILSQGTGESASFSVVAVNNGQNINILPGSEVLLRTGKVKIAAGASPALLNATDGKTLEQGKNITANNLYVVPLEGVVLTAIADSVLMIRGQFVVV